MPYHKQLMTVLDWLFFAFLIGSTFFLLPILVAFRIGFGLIS